LGRQVLEKQAESETHGAEGAVDRGGGGGDSGGVENDAGPRLAPREPPCCCVRFCCCCLPASVTETKEFRQGTAAAGIAARAETRRLWLWVKEGPCTLRVLTFLGGAFIALSGLLGILIETFNRFRLVAMMLDFYICVGGFAVAAVAAKSHLCTDFAAVALHKWCGFLTRTGGRGWFLLLLAVLSLATVSGADPAMESLNIGAAGVALALGLFHVAVGLLVEQRLSELHGRFPCEAELRRVFDAADVYGTGSLDPEAVVCLLARLDPPMLLSEAEAHAAMSVLDADHSGGVDVDELVRWWVGDQAKARGTVASMAVPQSEGDAAAGVSVIPGHAHGALEHPLEWIKDGNGWSLHAITMVTGAAYVVAGCVGLGTESASLVASGAGSRGGTAAIRVVVDLLIVGLGCLMLCLEGRVSCGGVVVAAAAVKEARFLGRAWGRGLLYMLMATVSLSRFNVKELAAVIVGFILFVVGLLHVAAGCLFDHKAAKVVGAGLSAAAAREAFVEADADRSGGLDSAELAHLMARLGLCLTRAEMEVALAQMDTNGDGVVSFREFLEWSQGSDHAHAGHFGDGNDDGDGARANPLGGDDLAARLLEGGRK